MDSMPMLTTMTPPGFGYDSWLSLIYRVCEEMLPISQTVDFPEGSYEERLIANRRWFMTG